MTVPAKRGAPLLARLMARCIPEPNSGCWLWEGSQSSSRGYGLAFLTATKVTTAHRAMLIAHGVDVPPHLVVRHRCDNPSCVNPEHLETGTQAQNMEDMRIRGRHRPAYAIPKEWRERIRTEDLHIPTWAIAQWFGVSQKTIRNIRSGK